MVKRYQTAEMAEIFSEEYKLKKWLLVETTVAQVQERCGLVPEGLSRRLGKVRVSPERILEIERVTNHDVIAFLTAVRERLGAASKWLHFGLTSYDLVDTALAITLGAASRVLVADINILIKRLQKLARRYRTTPEMGRTHGMFAQPITFGYKVASWHREILRAKERIVKAESELAFGKISGAVGSYTILEPRVEKLVLKKLGLRPEPVSTQIIPRDRIAFYISTIVLYACGLERITTEIRNLARSEIAEVAEPFGRGQKGSSAMPHKQNPIVCERIGGLVRVMRGYLVPVFENVNLWHERDLTNSSVERVVIADIFHLAHYITRRAGEVLAGLRVFPDQMMNNISRSRYTFATQQLMNRLVEKGMRHDPAYDLVQKLSFEAQARGIDLRRLAGEDRAVRKFLTRADLDRLFDLGWYIRNIARRR